MANFGDTQLEQVSPRGDVTNPVSNSSGSIIAASLGSAADFLGDGLAEAFAAKRERKAKSVIQSFIDENLKLAHATDQGSISSQEARMRSRALISRTIANNPSIAGDIIKAQKDIMATAGLGQVMDEGTLAEQRRNKMVDSAYADGFIIEGGDEEEGLAQYTNYLRAQRDLKAQKDNIALAQAKQTYKKGSLELHQKEVEIKSRQAISALAGSYNYKFNNDVTTVLNNLDSNSIDPETALKQLDLQWNTIMATVNAAGGDAGNEYVSNVVAPMKFAYEQAVKYASGEITKEVLNNRLETTQALAKLNLLSDPEISNAVATNNLLRNMSPSSLSYFDKTTIKMLKKNSGEGKPADLTSDDDEEKRSGAVYLNAIKNSMKTSASKVIAGDEVVFNDEVKKNVNQILTSVEAYDDSVNNPTEYNEIVDFIASPEMGAYLNSTNGELNPEAAAGAKEVLQQQYSDVVLPLVKKEFEDATAIVGFTSGKGIGEFNTPETEAVSSIIEPVFQGSGVVFRIKPGIPEPDIAGGTNARVTVRQLNKEVAPALNRLVRMSAHLSGNTDYRAAYENLYASTFETIDKKVASKGKVDPLQKAVEGVNDLGDFEPIGLTEDGEVIAINFAGGVDTRINDDVKSKWETVQTAFGKELSVTSGFRGKIRNEKAGGAKHSQHLHGNAIDVDTTGLSNREKEELLDIAVSSGFTGIGVYRNSFHFDLGNKRAWGPSYHNDSLPDWARKIIE